ncbi:hypothetical protein [Nocardia asiatica]
MVKRVLGDEPVIKTIGPAVVAIAAYLVTRGVIDSDTGQLIAAVIAALGGGGAIAMARAFVTPLSKLNTGEQRGTDYSVGGRAE